MMERGDMVTRHEPFLYLYYVHDAKRVLPHFDCDPDQPTSYEQIKSSILRDAEQRTVFVKDMCYHVADYLFDDDAFVQRVTHTYLIRTPDKSVPSYLRLDPDVTSEEIGIEAQLHHFERVSDATGRVPVVIDADDLQHRPEATVRAYCQAIGVPFMPQSLSWREAMPAPWQHVAAWHTELAGSRGIARGRAAAGGRLDSQLAAKAGELCAHHRPYYLRLRAHKIDP